jgi:peptidoglycan hydrolase-like protein with peptidoglycan-binding domain
MSITQMESLLATLEAELQTLEAQAGGSSASFTFTRNLSLGSSGLDVKALQYYLNTHGFPVTTTPAYAGSLGYETEHFGAATEKALALFQKAHGIAPVSGFFGPITRAYVNGHE